MRAQHHFILYLYSIICCITKVKAQTNTNCACSPTNFTWTLDLTLTCDPINVATGSTTGIKEVNCFIDNNGDFSVTDLIPVEVTEVDIFELDNDLNIIQVYQSPSGISLQNGDSFSFASAALNATGTTDVSNIPHVMQMELFGVNAAGQTVRNEWILRYTNLCTVYPFEKGVDSLGWVKFSEFEGANIDTCPLVSHSPSDVPSVAPILSSSDKPSGAPNFISSDKPSVAPTLRFTDKPSVAPNLTGTTSSPSKAVVGSTTHPSDVPSSAPVITAAPVMPSVTDSPSKSPSAYPSFVTGEPTPDIGTITHPPSMSPSIAATDAPTSNVVTNAPVGGGSSMSYGKGKGKYSKSSKASKGKGKKSKSSKSSKYSKSKSKNSKSYKSSKSKGKGKGKSGKKERVQHDKMRHKGKHARRMILRRVQ